MSLARILIVEDDAILASQLEGTLAQLGYQVAGLAATGEAAIHLALQPASKPDLILMDIHLRGEMTGIQAAEEICKSADIPVIYLTAYVDDALLEGARASAAYAYLSKPMRKHELRASLELALYKHKSEMRLEHLNQVLRAVRGVSQLLTREFDPQRLQDKACEILLRTRGYKFIWIGRLQQGRLVPVSLAGEGKNLLDLIVGTASDEQRKQLPGLQAAHKKQVAVCPDMLHDQRYAPWQAEVEKAHLRSTVAVPMLNEDRPFGVLNVYTDETGSFDSDELGLLLELAADLAFGLKAIDEEAARKRVEDAALQAEKHFRALIENAPDGVVLIGLDGRFKYASPSCARIFGYRSAELDGLDPADLTHPDDLAVVLSLLNDLIQIPGQVVTQQYRFLHKDGSWRWIESTFSNLLADPAVQSIVINFRNISERKKAEQIMQRQLAHLTAMNEIDHAITTSFNLRQSLARLLETIIGQLGVDACDVLLFNPSSQKLEYVAGQGFRTRSPSRSILYAPDAYAARTVLARKPVHILRLGLPGDAPALAHVLAGEAFVSYLGVPLITRGQVRGVLEIFQRSVLEPDQEWFDFLHALAAQAAVAIDNASLFESLQRSNFELAQAYDATIEGWSRALDLRDKETEGHTRRVTEITVQLAAGMGFGKPELVHIRRGALLHDIGKMGVPDHILLKPEALSPEEWVSMRKHPQFAYDMLAPIAFLRPALDIPYCHHEMWNGSGYPRGLVGEAIPLAARIFAVVDVWDALRSDRPYRPAWSVARVREHIRALAGTHFDPQVMLACLQSDVLVEK